MQEVVTSAVATIFGGDTPHFPLSPLQVAARAAVVYIVGLAIVRLGKSRLISRATPLDVILGFILGSLLSRGITGHAAMSDTIVASAVLVAIHWLLTFASCRYPSVEKLIKGNAYALVERGRLLDQNMLHSHVSAADLEEAMRLEGLNDIGQVEVAYKERNGEVSIIQRHE
jgi:uncharacterized membrane protein YcaP (DUF421 family)